MQARNSRAALITEAASSICAAFARKLASAGYNLVLLAGHSCNVVAALTSPGRQCGRRGYSLRALPGHSAPAR